MKPDDIVVVPARAPLGLELGRKVHEDDDLVECKIIIFMHLGREVSLDTSFMPSSSTLMVANSVFRTPAPHHQTTCCDIPKIVIFI
jgi:hypothetical protein